MANSLELTSELGLSISIVSDTSIFSLESEFSSGLDEVSEYSTSVEVVSDLEVLLIFDSIPLLIGEEVSNLDLEMA